MANDLVFFSFLIASIFLTVFFLSIWTAKRKRYQQYRQTSNILKAQARKFILERND